MAESFALEATMRLVALMLALAVAASPVLADEPTASPVVVLRGSSAPPTAWYEPPPQPEVQTVYVPVYYYPVWINGRFVPRHQHAFSRARSR
jgi:hypothetical protein